MPSDQSSKQTNFDYSTIVLIIELLERISRKITNEFWDALIRRTDQSKIRELLHDPKIAESNTLLQRSEWNYLYVPWNDILAWEYFCKIAAADEGLKMKVERLPGNITPEFVAALNGEEGEGRHGLLSLALKHTEQAGIEGIPYLVPGGRFNEMYGWDSYFISLGLLHDGRVDLVQGILDNLVYQILHYGKILNANRTYYLTRSNPPFLTSLLRAVYECLPDGPNKKQWLHKVLDAVIFEYKTVWCGADRKTEKTGLSRYYSHGLGLQVEIEKNHYGPLLQRFADEQGILLEEFEKKYFKREIVLEPLEDEIRHDRSLRESGHDTTYRLLYNCANLNTVDLNSLLYKYETDIADLLGSEFDDNYIGTDGTKEASKDWREKAENRKGLINRFQWNAENGFFFDFDFLKDEQTLYQSATTFYPLWAGLASKEQAALVVEKALPCLECVGGVASTSEASRGPINPDRPQRQWDYPIGWAPHQMLIWRGLVKYGYTREAQRIAYKWLYTISINYVKHEERISEKYDVVKCSQKVVAEYGNEGSNVGGFGWTNASFLLGLRMLDDTLRSKLNKLVSPAEIF